MIPDGFQYLLDDFWNFQFFYQTWTLTPLFYVEMLQIIQEMYGIIFKKYYFSSLIISKFQHFQNTTLPGIEMWNYVLSCVFF